MSRYYEDKLTHRVTCESCRWKWEEVAYYIGFGDYCFTENEDLKCPECGKTNSVEAAD